jgi:hypothetical protein
MKERTDGAGENFVNVLCRPFLYFSMKTNLIDQIESSTDRVGLKARGFLRCATESCDTVYAIALDPDEFSVSEYD